MTADRDAAWWEDEMHARHMTLAEAALPRGHELGFALMLVVASDGSHAHACASDSHPFFEMVSSRIESLVDACLAEIVTAASSFTDPWNQEAR